jgi:hypothetical protein
MSDNLPMRRPDGEVARPVRLEPAGPGPVDVRRPDPPTRTPSGVPPSEADIVASALHIGEIKAERVSITVNHYHAPVTQQVRMEVNRVEQTRVDSRSERLDYRPSYPPPARAPTPAPAYRPASDAPRERGVVETLGCLGVAFLGFTAFLFVVVASYRWLMAPMPATTTVVVPVVEKAEPPVPRTFLESFEPREP